MRSLFIDKADQLEALCRELAGAEFLCVDTEFVRERTYYPQLALIQLGTPELSACIDPLAIDDLTPVDRLFQNGAITKVFHAASQDLEIFQHLFGALPRPLFDTQIAAAVLGMGEQVGYANLVKEVLNVTLDKTQSRTDWLQRPLEKRQIRYAEDDVRYLARLYPEMVERLEAAGRIDWLDEDFDALADPRRYIPDPDAMWRRIKGVNRLRGVQLAILKAVAAWRERQAMKEDRPRRRIIGDELLIDMARLKPKNLAALGKLRGIQESFVRRHGETLLALIREALDSPRESWPTLPGFTRLSTAQEALVDALAAIVKLNAARYRLNGNSLANRKALEQLVLGERDLPLLQGWRRRHGGQELLDFIEGRATLRARGGALALEAADAPTKG